MFFCSSPGMPSGLRQALCKIQALCLMVGGLVGLRLGISVGFIVGFLVGLMRLEGLVCTLLCTLGISVAVICNSCNADACRIYVLFLFFLESVNTLKRPGLQ
jgi:hypothetical protein